MTPATNSSVVIQGSADGTNWVSFSGAPFSAAMMGEIPATAAFLRAMSFGSAGTFSVLYDTASTYPPTQKVPLLSSASDYTTSLANAAAIQSLLTAGSAVYIPSDLGAVYCGLTLEVPSYCSFVVGAGTWLTRPGTGTAFNQVRNLYCHSYIYVNGITISGGKLTVTEPGHRRVVGQTVYCENFQGNATLNGPQVIVSIVAGVSWTIAASGSNPSNTNIQTMFASNYNPLLAANVSRTSNVVTVLETGHTRATGNSVYIAGFTTDTSFNGAYVITSVSPGVSWTYASTGSNGSPTGTAQFLADRAITFDLYLDGNYQNVSGSIAGNNPSQWGNISDTTGYLRDIRNASNSGRGANFYNATGIELPLVRPRDKCGVGAQFDCLCDRVHVGTVDAQNILDDALAWGVTNAGTYGDTTAPPMAVFSLGNMGTLLVDQIMGYSPTSMFKSYCASGYSVGSIELKTVTGNASVVFGDPSSGTSGGTFTYLKIGNCDCGAGGGTFNVATGAWGAMGPIEIGRVVDKQTNAAVNNSGECVAIDGQISTLIIDHFIAQVARTGSGAMKLSPQTTGANVKIGKIESVGGIGGYTLLARNSGGTNVINSLHVGEWTHTGAGNTSGVLVYSDVGSDFASVVIDTLNVNGASCVWQPETAGLTRSLTIKSGDYLNLGQVAASNHTGTFNVFLDAQNFHGTAPGNHVLQFYIASQTVVAEFRRFIGCPDGNVALFGQSAAYTIDGDQTIHIDLGAGGASPPGNLSNPVAGNILFNYNATGKGLYGYTAAGAWTKVF